MTLEEIHLPSWYAFAGDTAALAAIVAVEFASTAAGASVVIVIASTTARAQRGANARRQLLQSFACGCQDLRIGCLLLHILQLGLTHLIYIVCTAKFVLNEMRKFTWLGHHGTREASDAVTYIAAHIAQTLTDVAQHLAWLSMLALRLKLMIR